jgi:MFS transporter, FSR family, fosmidomycin resistance protein
MLKGGFTLSFGQIGLLTLVFQVTASLLLPMVGLYTDRRPQPYSLSLGMGSSLFGMITLAFAPSFLARCATGRSLVVDLLGPSPCDCVH